MAVFKLVVNRAGVALVNDSDAGGTTAFTDWDNPAWRHHLIAEMNDTVYESYRIPDPKLGAGTQRAWQ